jgi:hypothetical protein
MLGFALLPVVLMFGFIAGIMVPFFGAFFALPFLGMIGLMITAPSNRACRLALSRSR